MKIDDAYQHIPDGGKFLLDLTSFGALFAVLTQLLPSVAALVTIVWTGIRIFETETVRNLISRFRKP